MLSVLKSHWWMFLVVGLATLVLAKKVPQINENLRKIPGVGDLF